MKSTEHPIVPTVHAISKTLDYLEQRWQDEKGYEDIKDYGKMIDEKLPTGVILVRMSKRPFGPIVQLGVGGHKYHIYFSRNKIVAKPV